MEDFMAFMNQTGVPVLIVMGSLLLLFLVITLYAALVVSGRADEQMNGRAPSGASAMLIAKEKRMGAAYE